MLPTRRSKGRSGLADRSGLGTLLAGGATSSFIDGPPGGVRVLPDGSTLNLTEATNMANCGKILQCSVADMNAVTDDRPHGAVTISLRPPYGPLTKLVPTGAVTSNMYVIVWVGDDQSENDNDPLEDGDVDVNDVDADDVDDDGDDQESRNPGAGVLVVRAEAFGPNAVRKVIEATLARATGHPEDETHNVGPIRVRILSWREIR